MATSLSILCRMKQKEIVMLTLCFLIGFALRFHTLDQKSLWVDEIHTLNDSRDGLNAQLKFYKENPTYLHPPLFFILTHLFYPFQHSERDLRIIPLIFGTLSIPMIYFLARSFSPPSALPCAISLTFMTYHISLSQDGRSYSLMMFLGMAALYFFMEHLKTLRNWYLLGGGISFAILFYTNYGSIPFIVLSQALWFYKAREDDEKPRLSSVLILNGLLLLLCSPWILLAFFHYKGQPLMDPFQQRVPIFLGGILYGVLHDWSPHLPLMLASVTLLIIFPIFSKSKRNALLLLTVLFVPIGGIYLFCKSFNVGHFVTSRYFINFLPLFFISIYLALNALEVRFEKWKSSIRLKVLFLILLIASNLTILPLYYRSEKQDFRGLVTYLKGYLREGDRIFVSAMDLMPGILYYFGTVPERRHYLIPYEKVSENEIVYAKPFVYQNKIFVLHNSRWCCEQYITDGNRLWVVAGKLFAAKLKQNPNYIPKGYFDGSFLNFDRFPADASLYLFLLDPRSPNEEAIDMMIK